MLVVGLTGGLGSGKTLVANLFAEFGTPIIDADLITRDFTQPHHEVFTKMITHFGKEYLLPDGNLDRKKLRQRIFDSNQDRMWLENLLHPLVRAKIQEDLQTIMAPYCLIIIPLLIETMPHPFIQRILVVDTLPELQIQRVMDRDGISEDLIKKMLNAQASRDNRLKAADDIIINNGEIEELYPQVEKLHLFYLDVVSKP